MQYLFSVFLYSQYRTVFSTAVHYFQFISNAPFQCTTYVTCMTDGHFVPPPTPPVCNSHLLPAECVYFLCNIMDRNLRFNIWQLRYFLIQRPKCVLPNSKEGRNVNVKCSLATDQHSRSHSFVSWIYNQKCFTQKRFFSFLILQINEDYATRNNHSCTFSPFIDED